MKKLFYLFILLVGIIAPSCSNSPSPLPETKYDIVFTMDDGTILKTIQVEQGKIPDYGGIPTKPPSREYVYEFDTWIPSLKPATSNATYQARFTATKISSSKLFVTFPVGQKVYRIEFMYTGNLLNVDWGDGTISKENEHTYNAKAGSYEITISGMVFSLSLTTSRLTKVVLGNTITNIPNSAFYSCKNLSSIVIPDSVISIGEEAFYECESLSTVILPSNITNLGSYAFSGCKNIESINIPTSLTSINDYSFANCNSLKNISIHSKINRISKTAFLKCSSVSSVIVDSNNPYYDSRDNSNAIIETLSNTLIFGSMNTIIPNSVTSISEEAFSNCIGLKELFIHKNIAMIGNYAFAGCSGLTSIVVDANNPYYDSRDNSNAIIDKSSNALIVGCKNTIIPHSVTSIADEAFSKCGYLTSIVIPNNIITIGYDAFSYCNGLTSIHIPSSVITLKAYAFAYCDSLKDIYCEVKEKPNGWGSSWMHGTSANVHWNSKY